MRNCKAPTESRRCGGRRRAQAGCGARGRWRGRAGQRATHQRPGAAGVEGAGGSGGHGRASRSTTPSRRLACGDLAGGRALRRPEHQRHRTTARARQRGRVPQYPPPCRLTQPLPRRGSGRMILSPGDGDASTGTCRPRRPLPGPPRRSGRRSRCAQGAGSGRCSAWWPGHRARRTRSSRP